MKPMEINSDDETLRSRAIVPTLRPKDVLTLDRKIYRIDCGPSRMVLYFEETVDVSKFCSHYLFKITDPDVGQIYTEAVNCLRCFVDNLLFDLSRPCFTSILRIELPAKMLQRGRIMNFYTLVRDRTYGSEIDCE